jgi:hypothetical protein
MMPRRQPFERRTFGAAAGLHLLRVGEFRGTANVLAAFLCPAAAFSGAGADKTQVEGAARETVDPRHCATSAGVSAFRSFSSTRRSGRAPLAFSR